jgi:hypothetical protein
MHPALELATNLDGSRRFYDVGEHPATFRDRIMVDRLLAVDSITEPDQLRKPPSAEAHAAIEYHRRNIAQFEAGHHHEKSDFLEQLAREERRKREREV